MSTLQVSRTVEIPDQLRIGRYRKAPELGPRMLFFSGGTALNGLSKALKNYTHNSTHLVTPFDSGGSSAELRNAFGMPSIGDLRSRLIALADETVLGHPEVYQLFNYRFPKHKSEKQLRQRLNKMVEGKSGLVVGISNPMRRLICNHLGYFQKAMPNSFDLRGASIGNLILAGGYLNNHRHLDPIIFLFSKLVHVLGTVRSVVTDDLHLGADLADGSRVIGQHRLTGKEMSPLTSPVKRLFLSQQLDRYTPANCLLKGKNRKLIESADLICYPHGSFYSSMLVNLLPKGVGRTIAGRSCPKVYIPNQGKDPEQIGMNHELMITTLLSQLRVDAGANCATRRLLNFIMIDSKRGRGFSPAALKQAGDLGIQIIDTPLISKRSAPYYDDELLVSALLSLT
ncbi:MAG: GAK system CofD-like protein [Candidatus Sedimenticola sp. (ex Thyasira tokunagai)]